MWGTSARLRHTPRLCSRWHYPNVRCRSRGCVSSSLDKQGIHTEDARKPKMARGALVHNVTTWGLTPELPYTVVYPSCPGAQSVCTIVPTGTNILHGHAKRTAEKGRQAETMWRQMPEPSHGLTRHGSRCGMLHIFACQPWQGPC